MVENCLWGFQSFPKIYKIFYAPTDELNGRFASRIDCREGPIRNRGLLDKPSHSSSATLSKYSPPLVDLSSTQLPPRCKRSERLIT